MSALTVSLAAYDAQHPPSLPSVALPTVAIHIPPAPSSPSPSPSPPTPSASSSQLSTASASSDSSASSSASGSSSSSGSVYSSAMMIRANEHLAVLLPKHLWKEDSLASVCDNFYCRVRFSMFERRHHCRKCGSIFCSACTSRSTPLLDTSSPFLPFTHPPHHTPISTYASKESPILDKARVCDACFDQIHGYPQRSDGDGEKTPELVMSREGSPIGETRKNTNTNKSLKPKAKPSISSLTSSSSSSSSSDTPGPSSPTRTRTRSKRRISLLTSTQPTLPADVLAALSSLSSLSHPHHSHNHPHNTTTGNASRAVSPTSDDARSYGELDVYPLTRHSAVCKLMGGGRWTPSPSSSPRSPLSPLSPHHTSSHTSSHTSTRSHTSPRSPHHTPHISHTSPRSPLHTPWNEKHTHTHTHTHTKGYFDMMGEIVSDEAGFRYRRVVQDGEGVRPF